MRLAARCRQLTGIDAVNRPLAACGALSAQLRSITHSAPGVWQHSVRLHRRLHVCASAAAAAATNGDASAAHAAGPSTSGASSESSSGSPRVCVLGGGFGGLYTAIKLESLIWPKGKKPRVTLVDQGERFVFKPLLYELLNNTASPYEVAPTFSQLLAPYPIQFIQAKVAGIEPDQPLADGGSAGGGRVLLEGGTALKYDWLVIALGAESDPRGVPGVREFARPFVTLEDAIFIKDRLDEIEAAASSAQGQAPAVVIVGAGYAGVELCSVIAERVRGRRAEVRLVTPAEDILMASPEGQREAAQKALDDLGVRVVRGAKVDRLSAVATGEGDGPEAAQQGERGGRCVVHLSGGRGDADGVGAASSSGGGWEFEADLVLWTAGSAPVSKFVKTLPFDSTPSGAVDTMDTLQVRKHSHVFALGDVSGAEQPSSSGYGAPAAPFYPATAQVAFQQADYAAWNVWAAINGRPLLPFRYQHLGQMMSLGATNAAVALPIELPEPLAATLKDSPIGSLLSLVGVQAAAKGGVTVEGPLAQLLRRAAYLYRQPTNEQRLSVAASWVQQAAEVAARVAQDLADRQQQQPGGGSRSGSS